MTLLTSVATFSGSVGVGATTSGSDFRYYPASSAYGNSVLVLKDDGTDGTLDICSEIDGIANAASNPITFRVSSVVGGRFEAMRITNTGNVGIGITPYSDWRTDYGLKAIQIGPVGSITSISASETNNQTSILNNCYINAAGSRIAVKSDNSNELKLFGGDFIFLTSTAATSGSDSVQVERVRITNSGRLQARYGISFPLQSAGSGTLVESVLNAYEEGTWTPGLSFAGGTTGITYSERNGKYTRIGRQVTVEVEIALNSKGTSSGRVQIGNLPFNSIAAIFTTAIELRNVTFTQKYAIAEVGRASGSFFRVIFIDSSSNSVECDDSNTNNDSVFFFSATYFV